MNSKTLWLAGMATVAIAAPALAAADSGLFVGGSIGSTTVDETFDGIDLDADATAYRIVGGYQFGDLFGIEVGYQDFGDIDETISVGPVSSVTSISADGWTLGGTVGLPLSDNFSIIGRAGVFFWDAEVIVDGFSIDTPGDENPYYGAGAKLDVSRNLSVIGDWSRFELDDVDTDVISIGFQYRFGG